MDWREREEVKGMRKEPLLICSSSLQSQLRDRCRCFVPARAPTVADAMTSGIAEDDDDDGGTEESCGSKVTGDSSPLPRPPPPATPRPPRPPRLPRLPRPRPPRGDISESGEIVGGIGDAICNAGDDDEDDNERAVKAALRAGATVGAGIAPNGVASDEVRLNDDDDDDDGNVAPPPPPPLPLIDTDDDAGLKSWYAY